MKRPTLIEQIEGQGALAPVPPTPFAAGLPAGCDHLCFSGAKPRRQVPAAFPPVRRNPLVGVGAPAVLGGYHHMHSVRTRSLFGLCARRARLIPWVQLTHTTHIADHHHSHNSPFGNSFQHSVIHSYGTPGRLLDPTPLPLVLVTAAARSGKSSVTRPPWLDGLAVYGIATSHSVPSPHRMGHHRRRLRSHKQGK